MAGPVAGGVEARRGGSMSQAVCVLPYAHDGQLPVPEPHHSTGWRAIRLATCFLAEQPHHRASRRLFWLRDTGKKIKIKITISRILLKSFASPSLFRYFFLHSAQVLWLYGNNITWIESGAFSNLRVLEELDLGDNPLQRLEGGAFRGLEKLQSLHMHRCKLAALPHDLFHKLYSLQFLYLQVDTACTHTKRNKNLKRKKHAETRLFM